MSGHSRWANIKRVKGAADAKRGKVFTKLVKHPLTDIGLEKFDADWKKLQQELKEGA